MHTFNEIHNNILKKSYEFISLHNEIKTSGIIEIKKNDLDLFSFLSKTIISQQISYKAANSVWNKVSLILKVKKLKIKNFQNKKTLKKVLEEVKVSSLKRNYIIGIYDAFKHNKISENQIQKMSETTLRYSLMQYRGIGEWTCDMVLIFFFRYLNIFPQNDLIINKVKKRIQEIERQNIDFEKIFSPYLSIFSLHLWKMSKRIL